MTDTGSRPTPNDDQPGQMRPGDIVQLTDNKGRHHTLVLAEGAVFHTHRGSLDHDDLLGRPEGIVVTTTGGTAYVALRSLLEDYVLAMPRGAAVIYPKDSARIAMATGLRPGGRVLEAGAGSGALTCTLISTVGPHGRVVSCERRADFAENARANVARWFAGEPENWTLLVGDLHDRPWITDEDPSPSPFDAIVLDMLDPWEHVETCATALRPGGVVVCYVATTTQLSRIAEALREDGRWTEPHGEESMIRNWHLEGLAVRPDHRMVAHTGFLLTARRLADGTVAPPRRRRPAKGAREEAADA